MRDIQTYYELGLERDRIIADGGNLEFVRTQEIVRRFLPSPPASILDVGGGPGAHAVWLARDGYQVHLIDPMPLHIEQATAAAAAQPNHPFTAARGDARQLDLPDASYDVALLFGPLYHLTERSERIAALTEAYRVLRPGGWLFAVGISRFASLLDSLRRNALGNPEISRMVDDDLRTGVHRNPNLADAPGWFTTAYFHHPRDLTAEVETAGFTVDDLLAVEGPAAFVGTGWDDPARRPQILATARAVEREPSLFGASAHLMAIATKPE